MWTIFIVFTEFVTMFSFMFWFSGSHVGSEFPDQGAHTLCTGRLSLNPWTTREVPVSLFLGF